MLQNVHNPATAANSPALLRAFFRYSMAAAFVMLATIVSLSLRPYVSEAFIVFYLAAVMLAGWFGRTGPGLFSVALSTLAADYYFIPPHYAFFVNVEGFGLFLSFLVSAGLASWLASTRKQAEEKQRLHFDELFDQSHEAIMLVDSRDRIQRINKEFSRIFGYTSDDVVDIVSTDLIIPAELRNEAITSRAKLAQGESVNTETIRMRKDGSTVQVSQIAVPVTIDGERVSYYYMFRDITEHKAAAEALRRAHAELAHLSRVTTIGELLTSIAHEVNQPITAVVTSGNAATRWLAQSPPNLGEVRDALGNIVRDATRAAEVISGIRTIAKRGVPNMELQDINEIIHDVLNLLDAEIRRSQAMIRTELHACPRIMGDKVQLQQVLMNLIMNAIDAMRTTDRTQKVLYIGSEATADSVLVQVSDTGSGIDPDKIAEIFNPFFTTKPEGIGMGLAISRSIVEAHGGRMWAKPSETGASLNFAIPIGE